MSTVDTTFWVGPEDTPDKYRLVRQFGAGGEAQLWKAEIEVAGRMEPVAVKILRPERMHDFQRLSARWAEQAELLRFVRHPAVVGIREHFEGPPPHVAESTGDTTERSLYLVMNWVEGDSLRDWVLLHPGREGLVRGLQHLEQLAEVLDWLHSGRATPSGREVVHGDLSPGNVMISAVGQVTLVDFGLVRIAAHHTVEAAGTPGYAAPEVWTKGEYAPAADRYGFGAVAYFVLTGERPPIQLSEIQAGLAASPLIGRGTPERLAELMRIFSEDPGQRPRASDWVLSLRSAATTSVRHTELILGQQAGMRAGMADTDATEAISLPPSGPDAEATEIVSPARQRTRRKRWPWVAAAAAVLVVASIGAAMYFVEPFHNKAQLGAAGSTTPPQTTAAGTPSAIAAGTVVTPSGQPSTMDSSAASTAASGSAISATSAIPAVPARYLGDMKPVDQDPGSGGQYVAAQYTTNGTQYLHSVDVAASCSSSRGSYWIEYDLGRKYQTLTATVGLSDTDSSAAKAAYVVYADGVKVQTGTLTVGKSTPITLHLAGVLRLRLETDNANAGPDGCTSEANPQADVVWGDAGIS